MTYLNKEGETDTRAFPRLEIESTEDGKVVFIVWTDRDTEYARFVAESRFDLDVLQAALDVAKLTAAPKKSKK